MTDTVYDLPIQHIDVDGLGMAYIEMGPADGPLALCVHGFPDHAYTWRHLMPMLAAAGFRAVAPWLRGYAPTELPESGNVDLDTLAADLNGLHAALDGDARAVLIGHDWGAMAAYRAAVAAPARWRRIAALAVPPEPAMAEAVTDLSQLRRSRYIFAFQLPGAKGLASRDDVAIVEKLWREWSPGYEPDPEDLERIREMFSQDGVLSAAIGYYRALRKALVRRNYPTRAASPQQATLYLHGAEDGCVGADIAAGALSTLRHSASDVEVIDGVGHFLHLEEPDLIGKRIVEFASAK